MVADQRTAPVRVDAGGVRDVVAVALKEADHRELVGEDEVPAPRGRAAGVERPVVRHLVRPPGRRSPVQAVAAPGVVGLPGGVRGLEQHLGGAGVVADHEHDVVLLAVVGPGQQGEVDPGHPAGGDGEAGRDLPVAAVDQAGGLLQQAVALDPGGGGHGDRHPPGAVAAVVAHPVDVDRVRRGVGPDLQVDPVPEVVAEPVGEALDVLAVPGDFPLRGRRTRLRVLTGHRIAARRTRVGGQGRGRDQQ